MEHEIPKQNTEIEFNNEITVLRKTNDEEEFLKEFIKNKPVEFIEFLKNNDIPIDSYNIQSIPRFIRIKPTENISKIILNIENEIKTKLISLDWLPNFYRLENPNVNIASSNSYKKGIIYGMDASSGAAILALNPQPGDNVLDICCAPGTKLCMISDMLKGKGTITGVDIADNRLSVCKTLIRKYKIPNTRLFICDGTKFDIKSPLSSDPLPSYKFNNNKNKKLKLDTTITTSTTEVEENEVEVKEEEKVGKKRKNKKSYDLPDLYFSNAFYMRYSNNGGLYDKVNVDAECSLDASIKHLLKHSKFSKNLDIEKVKELTTLQKGLIENGFNLLKPGGHLVYSTCSFSKDQNELVVQFLLDKYPTTSKLVPCFTENNNTPYSNGFIPNTYRFYPKNGTSGMFISKIEKLIQ